MTSGNAISSGIIPKASSLNRRSGSTLRASRTDVGAPGQ